MQERYWIIQCPICDTTYRVGFYAPWRCPADETHEPLRVKSADGKADRVMETTKKRVFGDWDKAVRGLAKGPG